MLRQPRPLVPFTLGRGVPAPYWRRVLNTQPGALVGYWRLNETSGSTIADAGANGFNGTYTGVTLNDTTFLDGEPAPRFTSSSSYGSLYSSAFGALYDTAADFDEGSMMAWIKVDSARWTDGQARVIVGLGNSSNSKVYLYKSASNNRLDAGTYSYGAGGYHGAYFGTSSTDWLHLLMTWSKANSYVRIYVNGTAGTQYSGSLPTFAGGLTNSYARISVVDPNPHIGNIKHVALWNQPITSSDDITNLATAA
ncbi:MAG: LamG-like jellyroll fold domain-containing protein [Anaerolineae bacterium]